MTWSLFDTSGRKVAQFTGREMDVALNTPAGGHMVAGDIDGETQYFDGSTVLPRPTLNLPAQHTIPADADWTLTDIPAGTEVLIDSATVATVEDGEVTITFPEAGAWDLELCPPFPWRDATCEVMVT